MTGGLMTSIYELSWGRTLFPAKLLLFFKAQKRYRQTARPNNRLTQAQACSSLSSAYYNIVGAARAQLRAKLRPRWLLWLAPIRIAMWSLTWLPLGAWCYWRMLRLSNRMVKLIGYEGMSASQCDVRQSILLRHGQYEEARKCIDTAFTKNPEIAHTRGLLHVGLAEVYRHKGERDNAEIEVRAALGEAKQAERQDPRQAARIYRYCADLTDWLEEGNPIPGKELRRKARELAETCHAQDQLLKL